ncbi:MAG: ribonuclease P protein component, partial [Clostridiales bacterium]|nr:ribonuclease P protein component [Clostridiales bacterium]
MRNSSRLKRNTDFRRVYRQGKTLSDKNLVLIYRKTGMIDSRIGFSVSKKFGNAVKRNKVKRQLRSICSKLLFEIRQGYDMIFVVRVESRNADFEELSESVYKL